MGAWATERSTRLGFLWQSLRFSAGALRPIAAAVALTVAGISTAVFAQVGDAPLGGPRRWEAAMQVGPYGTLNVQTGRVLTTLDVVGWGGKGPAISFSLYHNMTSKWSAPGGTGLTMMGDVNGDDTVTTDDIDPFVDVMLSGDPTEEQLAVCDLDQSQGIGTDDALLLAEKLDRGSPCDPMWTHSYSSHLVFLTGSIKVVADDGTEDVYPQAGGSGNYSSPPGVFNTLQYIDASYPPRYILTTKSQMKAEYSTDGKLRHIYDPSGNTVTCYYITDAHDPAYGKLDYVEDATGRTLDLVYNQYAKLKQVKDALPGADQRTWHLLYEDTLHPGTFSEDGDGYFRVLEDPMEYRIQWDYSACAEIAAISDKNGTPSPSNPVTRYYHSLVYTGGRLTLVRDPAPFTNQTQGFGYYTWQTTNQKTIYTDRRSYPWEFRFNGQSKNLVSTTDPLGHTQSFAYGDGRAPMIHEKTDHTNALNKT